MKIWRLTLDQEEALWLSDLMKKLVSAIDTHEPLRLEDGNKTNCEDIIRQIGEGNAPKTNSFTNQHVTSITDADGYPDEFSG